MSNKQALRQYSGYGQKAQDLLEPLSSSYGIDNFFYTELFPKKGKAHFISNNFPTIEKLLNIGKFSVEHNDFLTEIKDNEYQKFVWPQDPNEEVGIMLKKTGIKTGISFLYHVEDTIMNIGFASTQRSDSLLNIIVNKSDLFHHFIKYFESEAHDIIQNKSEYLVDFNTEMDNDNQKSNTSRMNKCIESMKIKKLFINGNDEGGTKYLTQREYGCLNLLCKGKSIKQIAYELGLSPRTIEAYLKTCKEKLNSSNKFDLFSRAVELGLDKICIPDLEEQPVESRHSL